ncbi:proline--tRNA ligase [Buchnera aphidicola (Kurisakia onigurumii)]|uniref:proline--tRNA ligase n=1 Tax=Buchnera aphidicola TaxID=9 RepID=UPI0031B6AE8F
MRTSKYLLSTLKNVSNKPELISHYLMLKSGLIRQVSSGIYTWLPTGVIILKKIKKIIREEMDRISAIEVILPILQTGHLWKKSKRINDYGKELFTLYDRNKNLFILGPTHEEIITDLIKNEIKSYKELPLIFYQIQTKFRDEIRPQFGTIRTREFIMKDAYSFHMDKKSLVLTYEKIKKAYKKIFFRMSLKFKIEQANSGIIGGNISHEFIVTTKNKNYNINLQKKIYKNNIHNIEIAHIFQIGKKYSKSMNANIYTNDKMKKFLNMGCYGIGVTRIISAIIEQNHDEKGIIWPIELAPFIVSIIPIQLYNSIIVQKISKKIYLSLKKEKIPTLFNDRNERIGVIFSNMDLIGIPYNIIISEKNTKNEILEIQNRYTQQKHEIHIKDVVSYFKKIIQKSNVI